LIVPPRQPTPLHVNVRPGADGLYVKITGDLDAATADELVQTITTDLPDHDPALFLDLAGVDFCGSAGIGALLQVRRHQQDRGRPLSLANLTDRVLRVLHISGVLPYMPVLDEQATLYASPTENLRARAEHARAQAQQARARAEIARVQAETVLARAGRARARSELVRAKATQRRTTAE
jgi:anti-sigma B factor antagonist